MPSRILEDGRTLSKIEQTLDDGSILKYICTTDQKQMMYHSINVIKYIDDVEDTFNVYVNCKFCDQIYKNNNQVFRRTHINTKKHIKNVKQSYQ